MTWWIGFIKGFYCVYLNSLYGPQATVLFTGTQALQVLKLGTIYRYYSSNTKFSAPENVLKVLKPFKTRIHLEPFSSERFPVKSKLLICLAKHRICLWNRRFTQRLHSWKRNSAAVSILRLAPYSMLLPIALYNTQYSIQ